MVLFDKTYFVGGAESNYINYTKKRYKDLAKDIIKILKPKNNKCCLDFGCATGVLVNELNPTIETFGTDISEWAIEYGRKKFEWGNNILHYDVKMLEEFFDYVLFIDVLEHLTTRQLKEVFDLLEFNKSLTNMIVRIPVSLEEKKPYHLSQSRKDKTHKKAHCKEWWLNFFYEKGYDVCQIINEENIYDTQGVLAWKLKTQDK